MSDNNETHDENQWNGQSQQPQDSFPNGTQGDGGSSYGNETNPQFIRPEEATYNTAPSNDTNNYYQAPVMTDAVPVKKKSKKFKIGIFAALIICVAAVVIILNLDKIKNTFALSTQSPKEYFQTVLKDEAKSLFHNIFSSVSTESLESTGNEYAVDVKTQLEFGSYVKELLTTQGLTFNSVEADFSISQVEDKLKATGVLGIDGENLLSLLVLSDVATEELFFKVPELSESYLKASFESLGLSETYSGSQSEIYSAMIDYAKEHGDTVFEDLYVDYFNAAVDAIDDVELTKNDEIEVDKIKAKYSKLTATITEEDVYDILINILEEAKGDERIEDFFSIISDYATQYTGESLDVDFNNIDEAIDELKDLKKEASKDDSMEFTIWVDDDQQIRGWEMNVPSTDDSEEVTMRYVNIIDGKGGEFQFAVEENKEQLLSLSGNYTKGSKGYTGEATFEVKSYDDYYEDYTTYNFDAKFEDLNYENKGINGKIELTTDTYAGTSIILNMEGSEDSQTIDIGLTVTGMELGSLKVTIEKKDPESIDMPSSAETVYDYETEINDYLITMDTQSLLNKLSEKLGIDVSTLFDSMGSLY